MEHGARLRLWTAEPGPSAESLPPPNGSQVVLSGSHAETRWQRTDSKGELALAQLAVEA